MSFERTVHAKSAPCSRNHEEAHWRRQGARPKSAKSHVHFSFFFCTSSRDLDLVGETPSSRTSYIADFQAEPKLPGCKGCCSEGRFLSESNNGSPRGGSESPRPGSSSMIRPHGSMRFSSLKRSSVFAGGTRGASGLPGAAIPWGIRMPGRSALQTCSTGVDDLSPRQPTGKTGAGAGTGGGKVGDGTVTATEHDTGRRTGSTSNGTTGGGRKKRPPAAGHRDEHGTGAGLLSAMSGRRKTRVLRGPGRPDGLASATRLRSKQGEPGCSPAPPGRSPRTTPSQGPCAGPLGPGATRSPEGPIRSRHGRRVRTRASLKGRGRSSERWGASILFRWDGRGLGPVNGTIRRSTADAQKWRRTRKVVVELSATPGEPPFHFRRPTQVLHARGRQAPQGQSKPSPPGGSGPHPRARPSNQVQGGPGQTAMTLGQPLGWILKPAPTIPGGHRDYWQGGGAVRATPSACGVFGLDEAAAGPNRPRVSMGPPAGLRPSVVHELEPGPPRRAGRESQRRRIRAGSSSRGPQRGGPPGERSAGAPQGYGQDADLRGTPSGWAGAQVGKRTVPGHGSDEGLPGRIVSTS